MSDRTEQVTKLNKMKEQLETWKGDLAANKARENDAAAALEDANKSLEELGVSSPNDIAELRAKADKLLAEGAALIADVDARRAAIERGEYSDSEGKTDEHQSVL